MPPRLLVRRLPRLAVTFALLSLFCVPAAGAQQSGSWDFHAPSISRAQLEEVLARYAAAAQSTAYSERVRAGARDSADSIRARLKDGDMRVGDRVRLGVSDQPQLSDTFTVSEGPALVLPVVGRVGLEGVLRSEAEARIAVSVDSVYRGAMVRVALLTRLAVVGGVARSGYYTLPNDALVPDAISAAGGFAADARLNEIYVQRGRDRVWAPESLQVAMQKGWTIDRLGLQSGDQIVVPVPPALSQNPIGFLQVLPFLVSFPLTLVSLVQVLK